MNGKPGLCKEIRNEAKQNFDINISSVSLLSPGIPLLSRCGLFAAGHWAGDKGAAKELETDFKLKRDGTKQSLFDFLLFF